MANSIITSLKNISDNSDIGYGNLGGTYETTTTPVEPAEGYVFNRIEVITEAQVTLVGNITGITAITFPVSTILYGKYTSMTLGSGTVMAYYGNE